MKSTIEKEDIRKLINIYNSAHNDKNTLLYPFLFGIILCYIFLTLIRNGVI